MFCQSTPQQTHQAKLVAEVVVKKPIQQHVSMQAPPLPAVVTIQEDEQEDDGYKSILSIVPEVLGDPKVTKRLMKHFKERMKPGQAKNLMTWLMSIGEIEDEDLEEILDGKFTFPSKSAGQFIFFICELWE